MKIGVDVGGTKIRVGIIGDDGKVLSSKCAPCPNTLGKQEVLDFIAGMISDSFSDKIEGIGIGVPSIVDADGIVRECVNIPSWGYVDIKADFEKRFGVPVTVRNDCNCFALGVKNSDLGSGLENMVCITLGTGVGAGIIINGNLYNGVCSGAGEIGEIQYRDRNYEFYCSSQFFKSKGFSGKDLYQAAERNEPDALNTWAEFGQNIGDLITLVLLAYSPQLICIGGSISEAFPYFEKAMKDRLLNFPYKEILDKIRIVATSSPDYLLTGAAV